MVGVGEGRAAGDVAKGRLLADKYCARCHVVGPQNRLGGIDSTPSFFLLGSRAKYLDRLATFFERRPHPAFVRVPGVARWSNAPAYASEFVITPGNIEDLLSYVRSLKDIPRPPRRRPRPRNRWQ